MVVTDRKIIQNLQYMLYDLESNSLQVILVPQSSPLNVGACNRSVISENAEWYRYFCSVHESNRKGLLRWKEFKTKIRRKSVIRILNRLISGKSCRSIYAEELIMIANNYSNFICDNE